MNAVYVYDIKMFSCEGCFYSIAWNFNKTYEDVLKNVSFVYREVKPPQNELGQKAGRNKIEGTRFYRMKSLLDFSTIRRAVRENDFCIIRMPGIAGIIAARECRRMHKPYCMEVVGNAFEALSYHGSLKGKLLAPFIHTLMKMAVWNSPNTAYITQNYLQRIYPTKGNVYAGVANVSIEPTPPEIRSGREARMESLSAEDEWHLGLIGALDVGYKGQDVAVKALSLLKERYPKMKLHLLGKGESASLQDLVKRLDLTGQVFFEKSVPRSAIFQWFDKIDIYLQPSKTEAHGRSRVEGCSRGCVCFGSDIGGIGDTLPDEFRFPQPDYHRLAEMIERVVEDRKYRMNAVDVCFQAARKFQADKIEQRRRNFLRSSAGLP